MKRISFFSGLLALILILAAGIVQSAYKAGIDARLRESNGVLKVTAASSPNALKAGDLLLKVDGRSVFTPEQLEFVLDGHIAGDLVKVRLWRDKRVITQTLTLSPENDALYLTILALVGGVYLLIGVLVRLKKPRDKAGRVFFYISASVAVHITCTFGSYATPPFPLGLLTRAAFLAASSLTPALFIHFTLIFPSVKGPYYRKVVTVAYGLSAVFFILLLILFLQAALSGEVPLFQRFMNWYNVGRLFFAAALLGGVANFLHSYFYTSDGVTARKLRWVLLGLVIGPLGFVLLWQLPQIFFSRPLVKEVWLLLLTVITPLTFAISIVRYHLLDIDVILRRSTVYLLVVAGLLFIYALVVGALVLWIGTLTVKISLLASGVAAVFTGLMFAPLKERVQRLVDKKFFHITYNYRLAQAAFTQRMEQIVDEKELAEFVIRFVNKHIAPQYCTFYRFHDQAPHWEFLAGDKKDSLSAPVSNRLLAFARESFHLLTAENRKIERGIPFYRDEQFFNLRPDLALVLAVRFQDGSVAAIILVAEKRSGAVYYREDVDLLKTAAIQTGLTLERIRLHKEILFRQEEQKRLDELNRMKSFFISGVTHDLQTPLTSIKIFSELLGQSRALSQQEREYLKVIISETERLSRMISNVLDVSSLERGEKRFRKQRVDVNQIVKQTLETLRFYLQQQGFSYHLYLKARRPLVFADPDALTAALFNLLSNCVKYATRHKRVVVRTYNYRQWVIISVKDWGRGMDEQEKQRVFDMYYRSAERDVQAVGGAGLGLTLVKYLMDAHGAKVLLSSRKGKGSTFRLCFNEELNHETHSNH